MKNNLDYYQHYADSDQHPKFKMLRVEYGWSGEGRFWALNNRIALSENCCLDLSKKYIKSSVSADLNLSLKKFDEFIDFLLNECELIIERKPLLITTDIIQENFKKVSFERDAARRRSLKRQANNTRTTTEKGKSSGETLRDSGEKSIKVKESKVKERKETNFPFSDFWENYGKKVDKKDSEKKWERINESDREKIFNHVPLFVEANPDKIFRCSPIRYLNKEKWNDEIIIKNNGGMKKNGFNKGYYPESSAGKPNELY